MKNLTLAIDGDVLDRVREIAARNRTTVNAMVREHLTKLASEESRIAEAKRGLKELMENSTGRMGADYVWDREELYESRMFPRHKRSGVCGDRKKDGPK